jgi:hypothetical protein
MRARAAGAGAQRHRRELQKPNAACAERRSGARCALHVYGARTQQAAQVLGAAAVDEDHHARLARAREVAQRKVSC